MTFRQTPLTRSARTHFGIARLRLSRGGAAQQVDHGPRRAAARAHRQHAHVVDTLVREFVGVEHGAVATLSIDGEIEEMPFPLVVTKRRQAIRVMLAGDEAQRRVERNASAEAAG